MSECKDCGKALERSWKGYCNPCYKRNVWRPLNTAALDRDRRSSREAKRRRRVAGEAC